jgi:hypothetical protein
MQRTRGQYPAAPPEAESAVAARFMRVDNAGLGILTGPNQDRRVLKDGIFARPECAVKPFTTTSANDNEALAIAA